MKTLNNLCTKPWYRLFKILYLLVLAIPVILLVTSHSTSNLLENLQISLYIVVTLEVVRRIVYYIHFGTIFPVKVEVQTYISNIRNTIEKFRNPSSEISETTKKFLKEVTRIATLELEKVEKNNSNDVDRLSQIDSLVTQANNLYRPDISGFNARSLIKVNALYNANILGIDIDWVNIDL